VRRLTGTPIDASNPDISTMDLTKPAVFYIALALGAQDRHGYGILQAVSELSGGRVPLRTGSLYRHLTGLIEAGWVAEVAPEDGADPRRGASYRLTPRGRQALALERQRLAGLVAALDALRLSATKGSRS
jgi:PadR family transcriptional regulator PadR